MGKGARNRQLKVHIDEYPKRKKLVQKGRSLTFSDDGIAVYCGLADRDIGANGQNQAGAYRNRCGLSASCAGVSRLRRQTPCCPTSAAQAFGSSCARGGDCLFESCGTDDDELYPSHPSCKKRRKDGAPSVSWRLKGWVSSLDEGWLTLPRFPVVPTSGWYLMWVELTLCG
jgi:hypothetical protein